MSLKDKNIELPKTVENPTQFRHVPKINPNKS